MQTLPYKSYNNGYDAEHHEDTVRYICQVNGEETKVPVLDEHKEQDQTYERADQHEQTEEESFRGAHTVDTSLLGVRQSHGPAGQHNFKTVF